MNHPRLGAVLAISVACLSCGHAGKTQPADDNKTSGLNDTLSSSKTLTAFSFSTPASTGIIANQTVAITVPFGTDVTKLVPWFTTSGSRVLVGSTVQTSGITENDFTNPVTYSVAAADSSTANYTVTVTAASSAKALTAFSFPAVVSASLILDQTVTISVTSGTAVNDLVASFSTTGSSVLVGSTVQTSGTTENDFTDPVTYTVVAADSSTADYAVTVKVCSSGTAPSPSCLNPFVPNPVWCGIPGSGCAESF
jgi:hypothetical protein